MIRRPLLKINKAQSGMQFPTFNFDIKKMAAPPSYMEAKQLLFERFGKAGNKPAASPKPLPKMPSKDASSLLDFSSKFKQKFKDISQFSLPAYTPSQETAASSMPLPKMPSKDASSLLDFSSKFKQKFKDISQFNLPAYTPSQETAASPMPSTAVTAPAAQQSQPNLTQTQNTTTLSDKAKAEQLINEAFAKKKQHDALSYINASINSLVNQITSNSIGLKPTPVQNVPPPKFARTYLRQKPSGHTATTLAFMSRNLGNMGMDAARLKSIMNEGAKRDYEVEQANMEIAQKTAQFNDDKLNAYLQNMTAAANQAAASDVNKFNELSLNKYQQAANAYNMAEQVKAQSLSELYNKFPELKQRIELMLADAMRKARSVVDIDRKITDTGYGAEKKKERKSKKEG